MNSLKTAYQDYFTIGAAINPKVLSLYEDLLIAEFNGITCENELKFTAVHPRQGEYTFEHVDKIIDFALAHSMKVRGHTLVWHQQDCPWFFKNDAGGTIDKETLYARMKDHISTVVKRYAGKIYCWDVVNEAISDDKGEDLRTERSWSPYYAISQSEEYIEKAFLYAHEADPNALLFYNEYDVEVPEKREKTYRLLKSLLAKGIPVHGLGIQAHYDVFFDVNELRTTIDLFSSLGLLIHITELDISLYNRWKENDLKFDPLPEDRIKTQMELYEKIFVVLREKKDKISNVTFWGLCDDASWLNYFPIPRKNAPLLFDAQQKPKEAYYSIINFAD